MITKDSVFAQAGKQDTGRTMSDFRTGMIPQTVAMAEDVNTYGNWSDRDLKVVCDEIVNALKDQGINPNNSYDSSQAIQLRDMIRNKLSVGFPLTGIDRTTFTSAPTLSGNNLTFTKFDVVFNNNVYYGSTQSALKRVTVSAQTISANSSWGDGVHYIYVNNNGTIGHQTTPIDGGNGATQCMLGSVFVYNSQFQANSWKFQPWLMQTSLEQRQSPTASRKGGIITPLSGTQIQMGAVEVLDEGINFGTNPNKPSIVSFSASAPFSFKLLYPGYNAGAAAYTNLSYASTHLFVQTSATGGSMQDISTSQAGKFICLVPCIVPTGQTLMIPAMVMQGKATSTAVFDSIEEARRAIYGLQYFTLNTNSRCIYLGQTLIVQVGITDVTDPAQFATEGIVPAALAGFTDASGQTGGGTGTYLPMPLTTWPVQASVALLTNTVNIIPANTSNVVSITLPGAGSLAANAINQIEVQYAHTSGAQGLAFPSSVKWWGTAPTYIAGNVYCIILEWINNAWRAGYLSMTN